MTTTTDRWFWGNILVGGAIGSTVDGLSGSINEYSPSQYLVTLQREGTGPIDASTSKHLRDAAKEYIILSYRQLLNDLQNGKGEYLQSLFKMLEVTPAEQPGAIEKIKGLSKAYEVIPEFAERVLELYYRERTAASVAQPAAAAPAPPLQTKPVPGDSIGTQLENLKVGDHVRMKLKDGTTTDCHFQGFHSSTVWITKAGERSWLRIDQITSIEYLVP